MYRVFVPIWPRSEPNELHIHMAGLVRVQLAYNAAYSPEDAVAVVDSMMRDEHRFYEFDLRQIAKNLTETMSQVKAIRPQVPTLNYEEWYLILESGWGWRLVEPPTCPAGSVADWRTKKCRPGPDWQPEEEPPPPEPPGEKDADIFPDGPLPSNEWLYAAAGLVLAFVFTRR